MKRLLYLLVCLLVVLSACASATVPTPTPTATVSEPTGTPTNTSTPPPTATATTTFTPTPSQASASYGPTNFPAGVDPLTGTQVADPTLLDRRPMLIKVSNLPRNNRPQWGLTLADIVFEYYTEEGTTRFAAVFYGNNASMVGPIRSGRLVDVDLVHAYKAMFVYGSAYLTERQIYADSDFAARLVVPGLNTPLTRYDPNGSNDLVVNTADLTTYATQRGLNGKQDLDGMSFNSSLPAGGQPVNQVYVRYSSAIYNRWDFDTATGTYMRYSDTADASGGIQSEQYAQLTDRLTNHPVAFDNLVVLYVPQPIYSTDSQGNHIYDIVFNGSGDAYAFRDGQAYKVKWNRAVNDVVSLTNLDGSPFAFKPGTTCFELIGVNSTLSQTDQSWRFTHNMP